MSVSPLPRRTSRKQGAPEPIAALNRVKILETNEPLVDIRSFCPHVVIPETVCPYLRQTVAEKLNRAQSALPEGYRLKIGTALRTLTMQKGGWDRYFQRMKDEHPHWSYASLRRATNKYHAPYDQPAPPGHCTGAAVDVGLLDPAGEPLDLIAPTQGWEAAYTWSDKINAEAKHYRMLMVNAMLDAGFSNCRDEYWHYSYGDSAWAVRVGQTTCLYGFVEPPSVVEDGFTGGVAGEIRLLAERHWAVCFSETEANAPNLHIGLFWAKEKPVTLRFELPRNGVLPSLFYRSAPEHWEPVMPEAESESFSLSLTPAHDRVYLATEAHLPHPEADPLETDSSADTRPSIS